MTDTETTQAQASSNSVVLADIKALRDYFANGMYVKSIQYIQAVNREETPDRFVLLTFACAFSLFKTKEFEKARQMGCQLLNQIDLLAQKHKRADLLRRKWSIQYMITMALNFEGDPAKSTQGLQLLYSLLKQCINSKTPSNSNDNSESYQIEKETSSLFGLLPFTSHGRQMMILFELIRIHSKQGDYRNALKISDRLVALDPHNPHVLSRCGRLCLEMGRKPQAKFFFDQIDQMDCRTQVDVMAQQCMNQGFVCVYDGQYKEACEQFSKVLAYKPDNLVAENNMATCMVFQNKAGQAIDMLNDLIKKNGLNITEQMLGNMFALYEVHYPVPDKDCPAANVLNEKKNELLKSCDKRSKDAVISSPFFNKPQ